MGSYVPEEEDDLRLPPELKGKLEKFVLRLQRQNGLSLADADNEKDEQEKKTKELQDTIELLEKQVDQLNTKCASLEAQNILVSVQKLDLLARGIAWSLTLLALYAYWCLTHWLTHAAHGLVLGTLSRPGVPDLIVYWLVKVVVRGLLLALPYHYNRRTHGSTHRRFEVFAIAFIVIARVRLCRWREQCFIKVTEDGVEATAETPSNAEDQKMESSSSNKFSNNIPLYGEGITEEAMWEANYEVSARFLYLSILRLKGLWTKSAQYLSSRADFMPTSYVRELKRLQDEAEATDWSEIQAILPSSVVDALTDIDETPLASASIGQVHTARLKATGEKVVVKVQHPHAQSLIKDDLWSLGVILRIVSWMEPDYEFMEILMREWAREAVKELYFCSFEMEHLKKAKASIQQLWKTPETVVRTTNGVPFQVEIPTPYEDLCNEQVLVMSFCEGVRVDKFDVLNQWGLSREAVMDGVAQTFAHMMYCTDIFNGDPHPGNLFVRKGTNLSKNDGFTLSVLDWGLAKQLTEEKRVAFCELVYAAATLDYGLLMDSYKHVGLQMKKENASYSMENVRFFLRDMAPRKVARRRIKAKIKRDEAVRNSLRKEERVPMKSKAYPGEFFFFVRVNELLHGLGSKFDVDMAYLECLSPYAERGLRLSKMFSNEKVVPVGLQLQNGESPSRDLALETKLSGLFNALENEGNLAGAQFHVLDKNGQLVADVVAGTLGGLKRHIPMDRHTLVLGFSCTKAIAATMAHVMVKEGYLTFDEPVCQRVWSAFCPTEKPPEGLYTALNLSVEELRMRWHWKRQISLWHILTHQAGMWSALPAKMSIKTAGDCEMCCAAFEYNESFPEETLLPTYGPGVKSEYHYMSFGWLVAGTLCGAYCRKHNVKSISFEALYKTVLQPKLSAQTKASGFRPCGGPGGHMLANTVVTDSTPAKLLQRRRESLAIGEKGDRVDDAVYERLKEYRGKEFLLDPRIWNSIDGINANAPAAGGRFSAAGLAHFYHDLGSGRILDREIINDVSSLLIHDTGLAGLQGATTTNNHSDDQRTSLGCGYQLLRFNKDSYEKPSAFGHAGVGGSIGFHHKPTGYSVGLMLNKADGGKEITMRILKEFADHFAL